MFAPTKTYRRWHRKVNKNQRRFAIASALASSASAALVMARGHRIDGIPEVPLVVSNNTIANIAKTSNAVKLLKALNSYSDVEKSKESRKVRAGKGKMRNRRYVQRRGPLIIYDKRSPLTYAFRNLPGVEICCVNRLNLLQLAPGGHLGRFVIWTQSAYERLDALYGTYKKRSTEKKGFSLPRAVLTNSDLSRLISSQEIQSVLRAKKHYRRPLHKKNPLTNLGALIKLNPYAQTLRRQEILRSRNAHKRKKLLTEKQNAKSAKLTEARKKKKAAAKKPKKTLVNPHRKRFVKTLLRR